MTEKTSQFLRFTRTWQIIGNDALHYLTTRNNTLRIQVTTMDGTTTQAEYRNFRVSNESAKYRMNYDIYVESTSSAGKRYWKYSTFIFIFMRLNG